MKKITKTLNIYDIANNNSIIKLNKDRDTADNTHNTDNTYITDNKYILLNTDNSLCTAGNLFFDIETTGFSRVSCYCYLIGAAYISYDNDNNSINNNNNNNSQLKLNIIQWLAESIEDEAAILSEFDMFSQLFSTLIHFNGDSFDIPFIKQRARLHNIGLHIDNLISIDLYKHAKGLKSLLKLESYNQTSIEHFLGIHRDDIYTGGELIKIYKEYSTKTLVNDIRANHEHLLLLHNYDDVIGLVKLCCLTSYNSILSKQMTFDNLTYSEDGNITLVFRLSEHIPVSILLRDEDYVLRAEKDIIKFRCPFIIDTLKFFYDNYKDYYYLPYEDTAMHISVAAYVDSECKVKATKENCYTKRHGAFIKMPAYSGDLPVFRKYYNEPGVYICLDKDANDKSLSDYDDNIIKSMLSTDIIQQTAYSIISLFCKNKTK